MAVSDWIMIISIVFAVVAIYPANERKVISYKLYKYEVRVFVLSLLFLLYLISFDEIADTVNILRRFYTDWGIKATNWALILFIGLIAYSVWRLFYSIPYVMPNEKLINFYLKKLNQDFDSFFALFNKYEKKSSEVENFETYKQIVFHTKYVSETSNRNPYQFVALLEKMSNSTFKPFFTHILNDSQSVFYQELKSNYNSQTAEPSNIFLSEICYKNPSIFIDIGGLILLREWYLTHLQSEKLKGKNSLYNQPPELLIDDYPFSLPLFYHVSFISMLYYEAIMGHNDFSLLSKRYTNMQSIFSTMIDRMIDNIDIELYKLNSEEEYPLGYHYLISEIFTVMGHWFNDFTEDEYYEGKSSLVVFFPFCFSLCMNSLFKGYENGKISLEFIKRQYRYHLFSTYFSYKLKPELEKEINDRCIRKIPKQHVEPILGFALDEELAISYSSFMDSSSRAGDTDKVSHRLWSLHRFLEGNNMI